MMPNTEVTIVREEVDGRLEFVLRVQGERLGTLDCSRPEPGVLRIDYVEVAPELRGTGLGRQLVQTAVDWARDSELRVVPICSYARMVITRDPAMSLLLR